MANMNQTELLKAVLKVKKFTQQLKQSVLTPDVNPLTQTMGRPNFQKYKRVQSEKCKSPVDSQDKSRTQPLTLDGRYDSKCFYEASESACTSPHRAPFHTVQSTPHRHTYTHLEQPMLRHRQAPSITDKIVELETIIGRYQRALGLLRAKCLQMENKASEKVAADHYIEHLQRIITEKTEREIELNLVIREQQLKIQQYEGRVKEVMAEIRDKYKGYMEQYVQEKKQNQVLKIMLKLGVEGEYQVRKAVGDTEEERQVVNSIEEMKNKWK